MGVNVVNARRQCAHPGTPTVDARRCYHRDDSRVRMREGHVRMAPGRVKCACSRNHVAQLSLHEEKRCSHRSRAKFYHPTSPIHSPHTINNGYIGLHHVSDVTVQAGGGRPTQKGAAVLHTPQNVSCDQRCVPL